jgi:hypothetical protein
MSYNIQLLALALAVGLFSKEYNTGSPFDSGILVKYVESTKVYAKANG